jgi:glycosyltransferase involved in cell wall biosynthesis
MKPEVTIGICVRNSENYIRDAIESILNQNFHHELSIPETSALGCNPPDDL